MQPTELHVLSNGKQTLEQFARMASQIHPLTTAFHIREKELSANEMWQAVQHLIEAGIPPAKIYINDRVDVAWAAKTGGVHLPTKSLQPEVVKREFPGIRVGRSVHSVEEALEMEQQGADYLLYGHVYATSSKPGVPPRGIDSLWRLTQQVNIPVIAIGGIRPHHIPDLLRAGAKGIAVLSGITEAERPREAARGYWEHLQGGDQV